MRYIDSTGVRSGMLVAVRYTGANHRGDAMWECLCDCGNTSVVRGSALRSGGVRSCGCIPAARAGERIAAINKTHGMSGTAEHRIWKNMLSRCSSKKNLIYGGRGITVCERWMKFENFYADMGPRPGRDYSIDRIDNNGNYEPSNCRWATKSEQAKNRRTTVLVELNGDTKCLADWAKHYGIEKRTVNARIRMGWSVHDALTRPVRS